LGDVVASAGRHPELVIADIDIDKVAKARDSIAVLRNQSDFARSDRAESVR
jgi:predicted amidohydrolase